ncbi:manganese efflux pump MntP family protein [Streptomyces andamanensis]|uniref:Manganese efflux pump MntP family protein n=1 Tax=Streptomyces andamanensis TaxID=1565035 RepID=A0ABV8TBU6_9ACTN|nr:manganese efflux pump [Streptomyces sp. SAT1]ANH90216.1 hypothetical protein A8713_02880 [Streptomyces sp. SAT1]
MDWLRTAVTADLIGLAANFDNWGVGLAYGVAGIRFPHRINALVNTVGLASVLLGAYGGDLVSRRVPPAAAGLVACGVLVSVALLYLYQMYVRPRRVHRTAPPVSAPPGPRQGLLLGVGLSFTNVANGFGATVSAAVPLWGVAAAVTFWGYAMIWLGNRLGTGVAARVVGAWSPAVAAAVLIGVGVHEATGT